MIVAPWLRLVFLILAGVLPRWQLFFSTSSDYSMRGLAMPFVDSLGIAVVIVIARTRNPLIDGEPQKVEVVAPAGEPLKVTETKQPNTNEKTASKSVPVPGTPLPPK